MKSSRMRFVLGLFVALIAVADARAQNTGLPPLPRLEAPDGSTTTFTRTELKISPNTGVPILQLPKDGDNIALVQIAMESSEHMDPRFVLNSQRPNDMGLWEHTRTGVHEQFHRLLQDFRNFYLTDNLIYVGASIAIAAPIANTHADIGIRDWYQRQAGQSSGAIETARVFKHFGDHWFAVPIYLTFSMSEHLFPDSPVAATVSEFSNRSVRALCIGAPTVGALQVGLGSGRPYTQDSSWHPFQHANGVAGHGFVGAIPFLTAASMTDRPLLKAVLFAGSFGTVWSRIQDDDHYFSQALLGWAIAYLAVESVNLTENERGNMRIVPIQVPNGVGLGLQIDY